MIKLISRKILMTSLMSEYTRKKFFSLSHLIGNTPLLEIEFTYKNKIRKIHTGFDGPATSKYQSFKDEFNETIHFLKQEKE
jgi:hypothetical protein